MENQILLVGKFLRDYSNFALSCDDSISAKGMRVLSSPLGEDKRIISGESGAVGVGAFVTLYEKQNSYRDLWKKLNIIMILVFYVLVLKVIQM